MNTLVTKKVYRQVESRKNWYFVGFQFFSQNFETNLIENKNLATKTFI